jgi:hypothetical protein
VRPMRQVEKVRIRRRRDEGEELESRSTDTHGHREGLERDLPNAVRMPVIAIVVIVTAARTSAYQPDEFHPLSIVLGLPVDDARLDIVQQEPRRLASQQVLVPDPSALQDPTSFSQRTTRGRFGSRQRDVCDQDSRILGFGCDTNRERRTSASCLAIATTCFDLFDLPSPSDLTNSMTPPGTPSHSPNWTSAAYLR